MATWDVVRTKLDPLELELPVYEQPWRSIYATYEFVEWFQNVLPGMPSTLGQEDSPEEQLFARFFEFVVGDHLEISRQFRDVTPPKHGVWELKTPDMRVFGWFVRRDIFIAAFGDDATLIKQNHLYDSYRDRTIAVRTALNLDPPGYVQGNRYVDVLSDRSSS